MQNQKLHYAELIKEIIILTVAVAIIAAAVFFFLVPSHTSVSSISGLGIVLSNFIPLPLSAITMTLNVVLLIIGFLTCGKEFGAKTVYTSILLPLFIGLFELVFPNFSSMTGSQELDALCYILVVSIGLSILFNRNASSGGLDIVAKILNKYLHVELGRAMSLAGMCVALSAAFVYDKKTVVLSVRSPLTKPEKQRLRPESAPGTRRLCALAIESVQNPAQRVVRGNARHGLLRAVQIIQPLGRHIRAQKTLGRLLGELFEIKPQAKARKALVRLDRSR